MTSKTPSTTVRPMPAAPASSRPRAAPAPEHNPVLPRKQRPDHESESEKDHGAPPAERGAEQASVIGEAERPQPPSEKPEAA